MGNELAEGGLIAVALVILAALLGIIFTLLTMLKNFINQGSMTTQNSMNQLAESEFNDYDQRTLTGTDVRSAMSIFDGRKVAIVIRTTASMKAGGAVANGYNYNCLLSTGGSAVDADNAGDGQVYPLTTALTKNAGESYYRCGVKIQDGAEVYNLNLKPVSTSNTKQFIRGTGFFLAELILDDTGTKVGICFTQQK